MEDIVKGVYAIGRGPIKHHPVRTAGFIEDRKVGREDKRRFTVERSHVDTQQNIRSDILYCRK